MLELLFGTALRSLGLGLLVWAGLKGFRIRCATTQRAAWVVVLASSLLMPVLMQFTTLTVTAPAVQAPQPLLPPPGSGVIAATSYQSVSPGFDWKHSITMAYLTIAGLLLLRLMTGVFLTARLWWRAQPVWGDWDPDCRVRCSAEVRSPVVFGRTILLPEAPAEWDAATRRVVLAHERAHVAHGDFFVLLAAKIYRTVFWFSPLSWWLDRHLSDLMEAVCDAEALREAADRESYASLLVEFASDADAMSVAVAMARSNTLARRIDRILAGAMPARPMTRRRWGIVTTAIVMLALVASVSVQMRAQAESQPPPPPAPAQPATTRRVRVPPPPPPPAGSWRDGNGDESYAIVSGAGLTMSGSSSDARRARLLRDKVKGDYIWFERDLKFYYIEDAATVARAKALFRPQEDLGRQQAALGAQQAALGTKQAQLGAEQARAASKSDTAQFGRQLEELRAKLDALRASTNSASLERLQSEIGEIQSQIGSIQSLAGEQQAKLGEQQSELGAEQAKLGEEQAKLGSAQAELGQKAAREMKALLDEALRKGLAKEVE